VGNLTVHVKRFHKEGYELLVQKKKSIVLLRQEAASSRPPQEKRKIDHSVKVKIDEKPIIDGCVSLVTESRRPFKMLDDKGFRMMLDPLLEGLGGSLTIGETGVYRDTGSKGTVGGKIVDINKIKTNFSMLFQYVYSTLA
jgi:hypothetical protein